MKDLQGNQVIEKRFVLEGLRLKWRPSGDGHHIHISIRGRGGGFEEGALPRHPAYVRIVFSPEKCQGREGDAYDVLLRPWIQLPVVFVK
jgi:hypothetical protein